jgi:hypothetical protein
LAVLVVAGMAPAKQLVKTEAVTLEEAVEPPQAMEFLDLMAVLVLLSSSILYLLLA